MADLCKIYGPERYHNMKIGFDISQTGKNKAGCGFFADSLIVHLAEVDTENEYLLYSTFGSLFWDPKHGQTTRKIERPEFKRLLTGLDFYQNQELWKQEVNDLEGKLGQPDIIHANNFFCPVGLQHAKLVYTLHDVNFLEKPEWSTEANRFVCFSGVFNAALYADMIIAVSAFSRSRFLHFFPFFPVDRIRVVHLGSRFVNMPTVKKSRMICADLESHPFFLTVGTLEPRKNLRRLLRTFARFTQKTPANFKLVLAGGQGWMEEDLSTFIASLGITAEVILAGYVSDDQLSWFYRHCAAFLYPSLFEGFGLPVLEAMSLGAAVITSTTTSLPEVAGDAALLVDPENEKQLLAAMIKISQDDDLRQLLREKARKRSELFSWKKAASQVLEIYREVAVSPPLTRKVESHLL